MFKNYLKTALRHIRRSKVNFLFKVGGLTLALSSLLIIILYVSYQLSFDRYHEDYENIYRINSNRDVDGQIEQYAMVPPAVGPAISAEFPEVRSFARISEAGRAVIKYKDKLLRSHGFIEADSSVFSVLTFEFIEGNLHALDRPGTIVLTETLAKRIFGNENPIGKLLIFPDQQNKTIEVTAVIKDLPRNTHLAINAITPIQGSPFNPWEITWDGSVHLFVRLDHNVNPDRFSKKINSLIKKNISESDRQAKHFSVFLQPISDIHLGPNMEMEFFKKGNSLYVYIFSLLGFFLLVITGINYINLSIADFHNRKKEIGVRKILGAKKKQIAFFVILEAVCLSFVGLFISLGILYFMFPTVLQLFEPNLRLSMLFDIKVLIIVAVGVLLLALISTVYPAFLLSLNSPIGNLNKGMGFGRNVSVGKSLLLFQFIVSIICITATLIVGNQIEYIRTKDLGYNRHNVISLIMPEEYPLEKAPVLKDEISKLSGVLSTSYAYYHITGVPYFKGEYEVEVNDEMKLMMLAEVFVDHDYLRTMKIKLLAGRNFDINNPRDSHSAFILNETAVREFGWDDAIGKRIRVKQDESDIVKWEGTVVGVISDFNTRPLHDEIEPVVMRLPFEESFPGYCLNIRIQGATNETIALIKSTFEKIMPGFLIDIRVVSDMFDRQYEEEDKAYKALQVATWIILLISAFGIFSVSIYLSIKRMKEFGIRKVLGATSRQIAFLHVGYFLRIAFLANLIALPLAYWMMNAWLSGFSYRAELKAIVFGGVIIFSLVLVILSSGYSSWRAGIMNPVDVINGEN